MCERRILMDWFPLLLSLKIAVVATLVASVVGIALAASLTMRVFPGRDLVDVLVTAPLVLPPTVLGYYLLVALGRTSPLGPGLREPHGLDDRLHANRRDRRRDRERAAVRREVLARGTGLGGSAARPGRAYAGRRPYRALWTVHLPLAAPGVAAGAMLGFARALGDFGVTLMVAGNIPGHTQTAALAIYDAIQAQRDQQAMGLALVLTAAATAILYLANTLTPRVHEHH